MSTGIRFRPSLAQISSPAHTECMIDRAFARRSADICHAVAEGGDAMPEALVLMSRTVGLDFASFSSISLLAPEDAVVIEHGRAPLSEADRTEWHRLVQTHPYATHIATAADPRPRMTDVVDMATFVDTEVYQVCLEPSGARYQAGLRLVQSSETFSLVSLWRSDRDFTDDELRPALLFADALRVSWRLRTALLKLAAEVADHRAHDDRTLTARQTEVIALISRGLTNQQIASDLGISTRTVRKHVEDLFRRTGARSRTELAVLWTSPARRGIPLTASGR